MREVSGERAEAPCLDREALGELLDVARRVERHFGSPQDIEWAIDRHGAVFVVQTRPVTALAATPRAEAPPGDALSLVMRTFGANAAR